MADTIEMDGNSPQPIDARATLDTLAVEILIRIICFLDDPSDLAETNKRFHSILRDDFVRTKYFIAQYGREEALYYAFGSGRLMTPRVLDLLIADGARISRYILQVAILWKTRPSNAKNPFNIHGEWTRTLPFPVFSHITKIALDRYPEFDVTTMDEVDGSIFDHWLAQRLHERGYHTSSWAHEPKITYERIQDMFTKYGFCTIHDGDPLSRDLPLALALEPNLYPLAVQNGLVVDRKLRDYVFRALFRRPWSIPLAEEPSRQDFLVEKATELIKSSPLMFISRTVAAEICMEIKHNPKSFQALKTLDEQGLLLFRLADVVSSLIELFIDTRSIRDSEVAKIIIPLFQTYSDEPYFREQGSTVRMVVTHICFFGTKLPQDATSATEAGWKAALDPLRVKLDELGLLPLSRLDLGVLLSSPFLKSCTLTMKWAMLEMNYSPEEVFSLFNEVMRSCITINCKGSLFGSISKRYPGFKKALSDYVVDNFTTSLDSFNIPVKCRQRVAPLSNDYLCHSWPLGGEEGLDSDLTDDEDDSEPVNGRLNTPLVEGFGQAFATLFTEDEEHDLLEEVSTTDQDSNAGSDHEELPAEGSEDPETQENQKSHLNPLGYNLGLISQDSLSRRYIRDRESYSRMRKRGYRWSDWNYGSYNPSPPSMRLPYPATSKSISDWVVSQFGPREPICAVFFCHAIANDNCRTIAKCFARGVPITLKHFKLRAKLGAGIPSNFCNQIITQEFFATEDDYLNPSPVLDTSGSSSVESGELQHEVEHNEATKPTPRKQRLRRMPNSATRYIDPDTDLEEDCSGSAGSNASQSEAGNKSRKELRAARARLENGIVAWIRELGLLLKDEEKKHNQAKTMTGETHAARSRHYKSNFHKDLASLVRELKRRLPLERERIEATFAACGSEGSDSDSDGEFMLQAASQSRKRRRAAKPNATSKRSRRR